MELSVVKLGITAVKWVYKAVHLSTDLITRWYLEPVYQRSHDTYIRRNQFGTVCYPLGHLLEVSIQTVNIFTKECGYEARIALRTQSAVTDPIERAKVLVRTRGYAGRQQEIVEAYKIGRQWEICRLNMPFEDLVDTGEGFAPAILEISIELLEISYQKTLHVIDGSQAISLSPTYRDHLNGAWIIKWGRPYNLEQYLLGQQDFSIAIRYALLRAHEEQPWNSLTLWGYMRKGIADLMTSRFVLSYLFSLLVATEGIHIEDNDDTIQMKWINPYKIRRLLGLGDSDFYEAG